VNGPGWLSPALVGLMLLLATGSAIRLAQWRRRRPAEPDVDVMHALMGIAMAGMLARRVSPVPGTVWLAVFALSALWFAARAIRAGSSGPANPARRAVPALHAAECAVMIYMLAPARTAPDNAAFAVLLAMFMVGYTIWTADQLTSSARARREAAAGTEHPSRRARAAVLLSGSDFAAGRKLAIGATMGYLLLTMV